MHGQGTTRIARAIMPMCQLKKMVCQLKMKLKAASLKLQRSWTETGLRNEAYSRMKDLLLKFIGPSFKWYIVHTYSGFEETAKQSPSY